MTTLETIHSAVGSDTIALRALSATHLYTFKDFDLCVKLVSVLHLVHRDTRRTVTAYLADILSVERSYIAIDNATREKARVVVIAAHKAMERKQDASKLLTELSTLLTQKQKKVTTVKNINTRALALAHSINAAYSSYRVALLVAYKALKAKSARLTILRGLDKATQAFSALKQSAKCACMFNAWVAIWNLDYLD